MLTEQQIQDVLRASRVVPLTVPNTHGPIGLEHLAAAVAELTRPAREGVASAVVERPLALPLETWEKLESLARQTSQSASRRVSASAVAAALLEQCVSGA